MAWTKEQFRTYYREKKCGLRTVKKRPPRVDPPPLTHGVPREFLDFARMKL